MKCPDCKNQELRKQVFHKTEADYCPKCLGIWFDYDELRQAKDDKDRDLNWLDIDLWEDKSLFKAVNSEKICPVCEVPLYEVRYGDSNVRVDVCNLCKGIWLDRGEFKSIIDYLKQKQRYEVCNNYVENLLTQMGEIFTGPETFREELNDFLTVLKVLNYKFSVKHPVIADIVSRLPK